MSPVHDVLILGAGAAGLAAGQTLRQHGLAPLILEARERVGGRVWSVPVGNRFIDLGASWIHGVRGNPMTKLAREHGLKLLTTSRREMRRNGHIIEPALAARADRMANKLGDALEDEDFPEDWTVAQAIENTLGEVEPELAPFESDIRRRMAAMFGENVESLSACHFDYDEDFPGGDKFVCQSYHSIIENLAKGLEIRFHSPVTQIDWSSDPLHVHTTDATYTSSHVICTLPLGILKSQPHLFTPELPATKQNAIDRLGFGVLDRVLVLFEDVFWPERAHAFAPIRTPASPLSAYLNMARLNRIPALLSFAAGAEARALSAEPASRLREHVLADLASLFGPDVPEPTEILKTNWTLDPWALGSYSHMPVGSHPDLLDSLAEPLAPGLHFAGEATFRDHPATVHGAYSSGVREAERIILQKSS